MDSKTNFTKVLPYDKTSPISIFDYSKGLLGKTLREFVYEGYQPHEGKGSLGQMVENLYFMLETNNCPEADFSSAGMELKCTPLKKSKNDDYLIKERLVCNMIDYCEAVEEDFEHSHFYRKCQLMLLLFYLHISGADKLDLEFIFSVLWKLPEKDLLIIRQDYNTIIDKIKRGEAHLLSEGDTMYLGACRKGQKGESLATQPYSELGAPRRAFSLKPSYMRTILQYVLASGTNAVMNFEYSAEQLVTSKELEKSSFEKILLDRFNPYIGKNFKEIAKEKNIDLSNNPKNKFAIIANAIASNGESSNINRSEEFVKAGLTMKTIRVNHNGTIKEAMSFENIDYFEVYECEDWYESRLYELFSSRFLFVVYREQNNSPEDYKLDDVFFWTMPQDDLESAESYWNHIRENIKDNKISAEYWWKASDRKKFHVGPKAQKSSDRVPTPCGDDAKKYCYWFNNDYVRDIVNKRQEKK